MESARPVPPPPPEAIQEPRRSRQPVPVDDEETPRRRPPPARDADDRDDEDFDERPVPKKKKRKKGQKSALPLLLAIGGGMFLLLVILIMTAFIWPGFLRFGGGDPPLLALVPANSELFLGVDLVAGRNRPGGAENWQKAMRNLDMVPGMPAGAKDLLSDTDLIVFGGNFSGPVPSFTVVFQTRTPYDPNKVRTVLQTDQGNNVQGKMVYRMAAQPGTPPGFLGLPSPRVFVIGSMSEAEFAALQGEKNVRLSGDTNNMVRQVEKAPFWLVVPFEGTLKQKIGELGRPGPFGPPPEVQNLLAVVKQAKGVSVWMKDQQKEMELNLALHCANDTDASQAAKDVTNLWNNQVKKFLDLAAMFGGPQAGGDAGKQLISEVQNSFKVNTQAAQATASVRLSESTLQRLQEQQNQFMFMPGFGQPPFPGRPPRPVFPRK